jgi:hypothetical protein
MKNWRNIENCVFLCKLCEAWQSQRNRIGQRVWSNSNKQGNSAKLSAHILLCPFVFREEYSPPLAWGGHLSWESLKIFFVCVILGIKLKASHLLNKCSTTWVQLSSRKSLPLTLVAGPVSRFNGDTWLLGEGVVLSSGDCLCVRASGRAPTARSPALREASDEW